MSILGLGKSVFRKKLTGLKNLNADQITADTINIPDGTLKTSNVDCNYINVCLLNILVVYVLMLVLIMH